MKVKASLNKAQDTMAKDFLDTFRAVPMMPGRAPRPLAAPHGEQGGVLSNTPPAKPSCVASGDISQRQTRTDVAAEKSVESVRNMREGSEKHDKRRSVHVGGGHDQMEFDEGQMLSALDLRRRWHCSVAMPTGSFIGPG